MYDPYFVENENEDEGMDDQEYEGWDDDDDDEV